MAVYSARVTIRFVKRRLKPCGEMLGQDNTRLEARQLFSKSSVENLVDCSAPRSIQLVREPPFLIRCTYLPIDAEARKCCYLQATVNALGVRCFFSDEDFVAEG